MTPRLAVLAVLLVVLAGCGGSDPAPEPPQSDLERAQADVTAKEQALADAQATADETVAAFCDDAKTYILALDRYGDVLTATAPTVGDVRDAGSDLSEPNDDVSAAAEAAIQARDALLAAEQELKDARAELKAVKATTSPSPSPTATSSGPKPKATPHPLPPDKKVDRVKQAQEQLDAAQAGITDSTPLAQASQQFNSAVVALEMSWLRLFSASGCLTDEQQVEAEAAVAGYTTTLQESLAEAGYYDGPVDGIYGPDTVKAVEALQEAHGLPVTGTVDQATADALEQDLLALGGVAEQDALVSTAALQQTLKLAGYWTGPVDGQWTPALTEALQTFQTALGVPATGTVDAATIAAFEAALAAAKEPPTPSEEPSEEPSDEPTEEPSPTESESD